MLKDGENPEIKQSKYNVDTKYTFPWVRLFRMAPSLVH